jgi:hypothetical protein
LLNWPDSARFTSSSVNSPTGCWSIFLATSSTPSAIHCATLTKNFVFALSYCSILVFYSLNCNLSLLFSSKIFSCSISVSASLY